MHAPPLLFTSSQSPFVHTAYSPSTSQPTLLFSVSGSRGATPRIISHRTHPHSQPHTLSQPIPSRPLIGRPLPELAERRLYVFASPVCVLHLSISCRSYWITGGMGKSKISQP